MLTDQHIATFIFASPFLALCAGGLIAQIFAIRSQIARLRNSCKAHVDRLSR